jgi:hypothetical protein
LLHQHQTKEKMKTTTMILAAFLSLQVSLLFAGNETNISNNTPETISLNLTSLMPVTPSEATFEDTVPAISIESLAPKTPGEATFE